jgi:hypothetical protein
MLNLNFCDVLYKDLCNISSPVTLYARDEYTVCKEYLSFTKVYVNYPNLIGGSKMQTLNKNTCIPFDVPECTSNNNPAHLKLIRCCEILIDFRTCLCPSPRHCDDICIYSCVDVKIDKICCSKVLIGGVLHKKIEYAYVDCDNKPHKHIKRKDIPFSCYVDFDCTTLDDTFKITGHEIICQFSEVKKPKDCRSEKTILIEKDLIKIAVQSN